MNKNTITMNKYTYVKNNNIPVIDKNTLAINRKMILLALQSSILGKLPSFFWKLSCMEQRSLLPTGLLLFCAG
jgi:hypothetical protein